MKTLTELIEELKDLYREQVRLEQLIREAQTELRNTIVRYNEKGEEFLTKLNK